MKILEFFVLALSLFGCAQYGNNIETTLVKSDTEVLKPNKGHVDLFFEDVKPTRAYRQIGMVESTLVRDVPARLKAEGEGSAWIFIPCVILGVVIGVIESENNK